MEKMENSEERKRSFGFKWIKSNDSGDSYLCPVGTFQDNEDISDDDLEKYCVNESNNPQND